MTDEFGSLIYNKKIPRNALKLIYKGTGKNNF
jgi:hypothetical protein